MSSIRPGEVLSIGQCSTLACLFEVSAPKVGNVHRGADFEDLTFEDFLAAAVAIAPAMEGAAESGVGNAVLSAVEATRRWVATNANLGTILLLAPLAAVPRDVPLRTGVAKILAGLTERDSQLVYEAIRLAAPGGLGRAKVMDVAGPAPAGLLDAMRLASDWDRVASQYVHDFEDVFDVVCPTLLTAVAQGWPLPLAIVHAQIVTMARWPDSLIGRKCGPKVAQEAADRAASVLETQGPTDAEYQRRLAELDFWLRADGHRRNPGTTADLLAAGLFVLLREGELPIGRVGDDWPSRS